MYMKKKKEFIFTPQQELYIKYYTDPKSATFSNSTQSGLKAGFSQDYSENIVSRRPEWFIEGVEKRRRNSLVELAEKNLEKAMQGLLDDPEKGAKIIQYKATEFSLTRLRKDVYSERTEHTGADGKDLPQPIINLAQIKQNDIHNNNSDNEDSELIAEN